MERSLNHFKQDCIRDLQKIKQSSHKFGQVLRKRFVCFWNFITSSRFRYTDKVEKQSAVHAVCSLRNLREKLNLHVDVLCIFQLVYCLTIGAYGRDGDLVLGLTAALAWELPNKVNSKISNLLHRRSRSVVYPKMEAFLQSWVSCRYSLFFNRLFPRSFNMYLSWREAYRGWMRLKQFQASKKSFTIE